MILSNMYSSTYSSLCDFLKRIFSCSFFQGSSMAFTDVRDGSKGFVKRVASSFSMRKKKNATSTGGGNNEPKLLPRSKSTGSTNYESMKTNKSFAKWRSFDDSDSIWLSSDCASPTSLLEERRLSVAFRFSVDDSVVSWLSNLANSLNHQDAASAKDRFRIPRSSKESAEKKVSFSQLESEKPSLAHEISAEVLESKSITKVDEPLFWPYEQRFDWTPEDILKHFSMSPRRKKLLNAKMSSGNSSPRSMRAQLLQARKVDLKDGCKKKLVFNGPVTNTSKKIPELKRTFSNKKNESSNKNEPIRNCVKRNKSLPSRLRKSSKPCSKVVPIEAAEEVIIAEERAKAEITTRKLINRRSKTMLEDDFAFLNDFSIEKAVGLGEFKGREGIDSEFNSDTFLFDDSL
ncbi:hypothetical protein Bca52824_074290 [Brassica carinata]|uniref:Uncharacterized protein n=1 Tax=Brassica carinata TaxID=52824 RepID=A0A8X7PNB2_BRACI|nr:hypothetical protein Bca52824_074290 [Brassica carinata]